MQVEALSELGKGLLLVSGLSAHRSIRLHDRVVNDTNLVAPSRRSLVAVALKPGLVPKVTPENPKVIGDDDIPEVQIETLCDTRKCL